jgi:hypothetical protein
MISPLQIGLTDIATLLTESPLGLSFLVLLVSGYVFLAVSGRKTLLWNETTASERFLIGVAFSVGIESTLFFAFSGIVATLGIETDLETVTIASSLVSSTILVVFSLGLKAQGFADYQIRKGLSYLTLAMTYVFFILTMMFAWFLLTSLLYNPGISMFFIPYLQGNSAIWYAAAVLAGVFYLIYSGLYEKRLHSYVYLGRTVEFVSPFRVIRLGSKSTRIKFAAVGLIVILGSTLAVAADKEFSILTPSVRTSTVQVTLPAPSGNQRLESLAQIQSLALFAYNNQSEPCSIAFYQPFNETIAIKTPLTNTFSIGNFSIQNPSHISNYSASYQSMYYRSEVFPWQQLTIIDMGHLVISLSPNPGKVQTLFLWFANLTRGATFDVRLQYYVHSYPDVGCTEKDTYYRATNSTIVQHTFVITNHQNYQIGLNSIILSDFAGLNILSANTTVTVNGEVLSGLGLNNFNEVDLYNHIISAEGSLNVTINGVTHIL